MDRILLTTEDAEYAEKNNWMIGIMSEWNNVKKHHSSIPL
jgi:hypothetical protein